MQGCKIITILFLLGISLAAHANKNWVQGIYINETTMQNANYLSYLISRSKAVGINTFVIDYNFGSKAYRRNIALVKQNNLRYVARIIVFPKGGTNSQVLSPAYWQKKYRLVEQAIALGADEIQLDYIRYSSTQPPSSQNAQNIYRVIRWFKSQLEPNGVPLEIDVFGVSSFGDSIYIGQSLPLFASAVDAICPMVYPSHYEPYEKYATMPYFTVYSSLQALRKQFDGALPFKLIPFIELFNYRHRFSSNEIFSYISEQLLAVEDSKADGWYAWSANNKYNNLFIVLRKN